VIGLLGSLVFHAFYFGWYSWFVLQLTILLPLFSLLVSLPAMLRARLYVTASDSCFRQDNAYVSVRVENRLLPVPRCSFRLRLVNRLSGHSEVLRRHVEGGNNWYARLDTTHVGVLSCCVEKARVYDYLKLFRIPVRAGQTVEVLVRPREEEPSSLPNLSRFLTKQLKPKPGGGFSEEHELRDYREGDPLRDIHWKLSVKTDRLILREAQEPVRRRVLLTLDLAGMADQIDSVLGRFLWMSKWLLEHEVSHELLWIDPSNLHLQTAQISDEKNLEDALQLLLHSQTAEDTPSVADRRFSNADWRYHIPTEQEVGM